MCSILGNVQYYLAFWVLKQQDALSFTESVILLKCVLHHFILLIVFYCKFHGLLPSFLRFGFFFYFQFTDTFMHSVSCSTLMYIKSLFLCVSSLGFITVNGVKTMLDQNLQLLFCRKQIPVTAVSPFPDFLNILLHQLLRGKSFTGVLVLLTIYPGLLTESKYPVSSLNFSLLEKRGLFVIHLK